MKYYADIAVISLVACFFCKNTEDSTKIKTSNTFVLMIDAEH